MSLTFRKPKLEDYKWAGTALRSTGIAGSDRAFGTVYLWEESYGTMICEYKGYVIIRFSDEQFYAYVLPFGADNLSEFYELTKKDAQMNGKNYKIWGMTTSEIEKVEYALPDVFTFLEDRKNADYIYASSDLISLAGRKYHGKRNHVTRFYKKYPSFVYENITEDNVQECLTIAQEWQDGKDTEDFIWERKAIEKAIDGFSVLGLKGGMIRIENKPVAFTMGEPINKDTFVIHFEKALNGYEGLYTVINQEFAKRNLSEYSYINREEDLGIEGLRQAKLSYYPIRILEKYSGVLKEDSKG